MRKHSCWQGPTRRGEESENRGPPHDFGRTAGRFCFKKRDEHAYHKGRGAEKKRVDQSHGKKGGKS